MTPPQDTVSSVWRTALSMGGHRPAGDGFLSAEDFDATGILTGVEPCASSYWWMPELLQGTEGIPSASPSTGDAPVAGVGAVDAPLPQFGMERGQAARRIASRSTAAA
jgi:hypothetical protein